MVNFLEIDIVKKYSKYIKISILCFFISVFSYKVASIVRDHLQDKNQDLYKSIVYDDIPTLYMHGSYALYGTYAVIKNINPINFAVSFVAMATSVSIAKKIIAKERPNGKDKKSFPSGHASTSSFTAAYIHKYHGLKYAAPLYIASLFISHTRVELNKHDYYDIFGGLIFGLFFGFFADRIALYFASRFFKLFSKK
jgi:membrane-associated phospholipid phosphatase